MWRLREIELNFVFREWEPYNGTAPPSERRKAQMPHKHLVYAAFNFCSVAFILQPRSLSCCSLFGVIWNKNIYCAVQPTLSTV